MSYRITAPASLPETVVALPASKSICNRALILNALSGSPYPVGNLSDCDDTRVLTRALTTREQPYDVGAAGTSMRFLTAYLALQPGLHAITGSERMKQRPIRILVEALRTLGARIDYAEREGFPPLRIEGGHLRGGRLDLPGDVSSQYISALLMIAPLLPEGLTLRLTGTVISRPYIAMTQRLMEAYGVRTELRENAITVYPQRYTPLPFRVESDWSAASYWYEIVALTENGSLELAGLERESMQGDARIADFFRELGVATEYTEGGIRIRRIPAGTGPLELDLTDQPDMAQTLVVTAVLLERPFRFTGLQSLRIKETDRLTALQNECAELGARITESEGSVLTWDGKRFPEAKEPAIDTYDDHRMAMAFAPAALRFPSVRINRPEVVCKSYPGFWNDLQQAGFTRTLIEETP